MGRNAKSKSQARRVRGFRIFGHRMESTTGWTPTLRPVPEDPCAEAGPPSCPLLTLRSMRAGTRWVFTEPLPGRGSGVAGPAAQPAVCPPAGELSDSPSASATQPVGGRRVRPSTGQLTGLPFLARRRWRSESPSREDPALFLNWQSVVQHIPEMRLIVEARIARQRSSWLRAAWLRLARLRCSWQARGARGAREQALGFCHAGLLLRGASATPPPGLRMALTAAFPSRKPHGPVDLEAAAAPPPPSPNQGGIRRGSGRRRAGQSHVQRHVEATLVPWSTRHCNVWACRHRGRHEVGALEDAMQMACWFWSRVGAAMIEDPVWGCAVLRCNVHVQSPQGLGRRRLNPGPTPSNLRGQYSLGWCGPGIGGKHEPWDGDDGSILRATREAWRNDEVFTGGCDARSCGRWPKPPPGLSGPLKELPRRGAAVFITLWPEGSFWNEGRPDELDESDPFEWCVTVEVRGFDFDADVRTAAAEFKCSVESVLSELADCGGWDWSGLPPDQETDRLEHLERDQREEREAAEEDDFPDDLWVPDE